jgi:hypothetical protein
MNTCNIEQGAEGPVFACAYENMGKALYETSSRLTPRIVVADKIGDGSAGVEIAIEYSERSDHTNKHIVLAPVFTPAMARQFAARLMEAANEAEQVV